MAAEHDSMIFQPHQKMKVDGHVDHLQLWKYWNYIATRKECMAKPNFLATGAAQFCLEAESWKVL